MPEPYTNGTNHDSSGDEGREPSYVRLAKYLSGYSTLNYDPSKQVIGRSPSPIRPSQELVEKPPKEPPIMETTTSFIEQRIERLYGPGSLAQVFHARSSSSPRVCKTPQTKPTQTASIVENSKSVPVMKLLRPEFRAQLNSATAPSPMITPKRIPRKIVTNGDSVDACKPVKKQLIPSPTEEAKDGNYFLKKHDAEVKGLEEVAKKCEVELVTCKSENGCGVLRAISGKARLLIAEKLNQFKGLCFNNLNQSKTENFPTTNEDLAGFWDMVMIQVDDVHKQFNNLDKLRNNDWSEEKAVEIERKTSTKPPSLNKNKANGSNKVQTEASKARDEARRKMIQERRQAMKQKVSPNATPASQQPSNSLFIV